jgi:hypothetical protein
MSWATFDDGFGGKTKTTSSVHPGLYTLTESNSKGSGVDGAVEVKLGERVLGPNGEPVWDAMSNGGAEGGKEGPRIVATGT